MRHIKLIGLTALAAFATTALLAVAATGASAAEPEWGHCVPAKKGFFEDSNCTKRDEKKGKPKGKFEWDSGAAVACYEKKGGKYKNKECTEEDLKKGVPKGKYEKTGGAKFTGAGGAGILYADEYQCYNAASEYIQAPRGDCTGEGGKGYSSAGGVEVECSSESASGEATASDEAANISVRFKGCVLFGSIPMETTGLPEGEIQVNTLKGKLGYINKAKHEVGVVLEPATAGGLFTEFEAAHVFFISVGEGNSTHGAFYEETGPGVPTGHDGIISGITPVNQMTHTFTQVYKVEQRPYNCTAPTCVASTQDKEVVNLPTSFEGGQFEGLEMFKYFHEEGEESTLEWSSAGEEIRNVNTVEGEAEIKG